MKTRVRKWKRYRDSIDRMAGGTSVTHHERLEKGDDEALRGLAKSETAIAMAGESEKEGTPYERYLRGKRRNLYLKICLLVAVIVGMILLYLFWVR